MKQNISWRSCTAIVWRASFLGVILPLLLCATACGQSSRSRSFSDDFKNFEAYESALLDSLILYESLKPLHQFQTQANEYLRKENQALRTENIMLRLQYQVREEMYNRHQQQHQERRSRQRWLDRALGFGLGLLF